MLLDARSVRVHEKSLLHALLVYPSEATFWGSSHLYQVVFLSFLAFPLQRLLATFNPIGRHTIDHLRCRPLSYCFNSLQELISFNPAVHAYADG
jgi:hypothetical protein